MWINSSHLTGNSCLVLSEYYYQVAIDMSVSDFLMKSLKLLFSIKLDSPYGSFNKICAIESTTLTTVMSYDGNSIYHVQNKLIYMSIMLSVYQF